MTKADSYLSKCRDYPFRLYTTLEFAQLLRVSRWYIYDLIRKGIVKPIKSRTNENKNPKYATSYYTDSMIMAAIDYRFPGIKNLQKKELKCKLNKRAQGRCEKSGFSK